MHSSSTGLGVYQLLRGLSCLGESMPQFGQVKGRFALHETARLILQLEVHWQGLVSLLCRVRVTANPGPRLHTAGVVAFSYHCGLGGMKTESQCWRGAVATGAPRAGSTPEVTLISRWCHAAAAWFTEGWRGECTHCVPNLGQCSYMNSWQFSKLGSGLVRPMEFSCCKDCRCFWWQRGLVEIFCLPSPHNTKSLVTLSRSYLGNGCQVE